MFAKVSCLIFCFICLGTFVSAQLSDCSSCDVLELKTSDISGNTSDELELLRNEIFARNNYRFKNKDFTNHFSQFEWYQPKYGFENEIKLNDIEKQNVKLFLAIERQIDIEKENIAKELIALKRALNQGDIESVLPKLNDKIAIDALQIELENLRTLMNRFDLSQLNWIEDNAKQRITNDNGQITETFEFTTNRKEINFSHIVKNETGLNSQITLKNDLILVGSETWHFTLQGSNILLKKHTK